MSNPSTSAEERILEKHKRQIEASPGVIPEARAYALAVIEDIANDLRARARAAPLPEEVRDLLARLDLDARQLAIQFKCKPEATDYGRAKDLLKRQSRALAEETRLKVNYWNEIRALRDERDAFQREYDHRELEADNG